MCDNLQKFDSISFLQMYSLWMISLTAKAKPNKAQGITVPENRLFVKPTFRFFFMSQAPAGGRRTVVGGARVVSGAEKKII